MTQTGERARFAERLRQARESLGLSIEEAARRLEVDPQKLGGWESGRSAPDDDAFWKAAEAYGRPVAYFFSDAPPAPARQDFRAAKSIRDEDVRRVAIAEFEELCRAQYVLKRRQGEVAEPELRRLRDNTRGIEDAEALAEKIREVSSLDGRPIENVRELLESWGVQVFFLNFPGRELSGSSWWHPTYGPAALINRGEAAGRRNFTMAHELAHLLRLDVQPLCDLNEDNAEELFANRFAAAFLMPAVNVSRHAELLRDSGELPGWDTERSAIARIAARYGTSVEATSYRLEDLGFLPKGYSKANRAELGREYFRGSKGRRWQKAVRDLGSEYISSVRQAYGRGELSLAAVADLLRIEVDQALEWLEGEASEG